MKELMEVNRKIAKLSDDDKRKLAVAIASSVSNLAISTPSIDLHSRDGRFVLECFIFASLLSYK